MNRTIKGQERALEILEHSLNEDKVAGSYLFHGPDGVGKFATAVAFAQAINCHATKEKRPCGVCISCQKISQFTHPDLLHIFPFPKPDGNKADISIDGELKTEKILKEYEAFITNKKETPWRDYFFSKNSGIRIASIRMLEHRIRLSPNEAIKKVYIIEQADKMTNQAANAFLKTLEEPPADTVIILTSSKPSALLPTILSRCQKSLSNQLVPKSSNKTSCELAIYRKCRQDYIPKLLMEIWPKLFVWQKKTVWTLVRACLLLLISSKKKMILNSWNFAPNLVTKRVKHSWLKLFLN